MAIGETKLLIINEHIKLCRAKKLEMEVSPRTKQHCQTRGILEGHQHPLGGDYGHGRIDLPETTTFFGSWHPDKCGMIWHGIDTDPGMAWHLCFFVVVAVF